VALFSAINVTTYAGPYDMTTDTNKLSVSGLAAELDSTVFVPPTDANSGWRTRIGGLKDVEVGVEGFWQSGTSQAIDPQAFTNLGVADTVLTISPTGVATDPCYIMQADEFAYSIGDQVGAIFPFKLTAKGSNLQGLVRGQLAAAKQTKSATGALGSACLLGAPTSTQYVYAVLHVFSAGTTITVQVQSDDNSGMTTPTTRGTFTAQTAAGGTWLTRVAGPFALETYWRLNISAITGTFSVAGAIGIQ
jgi:hypothetical protein